MLYPHSLLWLLVTGLNVATALSVWSYVVCYPIGNHTQLITNGLSVIGRKGTPLPTSILWLKAFPHLRTAHIVIMIGENTLWQEPRPKCTVPLPLILHVSRRL